MWCSLLQRTSVLFVGVSLLVAAGAIIFVRRRFSTQQLRTMIDLVNQPHVHIRDRQRVDNLIQTFISGGRNRIQVVADFDRTLSRFRTNSGEIVATCHNALDEHDQMHAKYRAEATKLRDYYYAIEIDDSLTKEQKYPHMVDWWTKAHNLLVEAGLTKEMIAHSVEKSNIVLRDNSAWFLKELHAHKVPILIFSAGLGDIIEEVIKQQYTMYNNIHIVSNYMDFDSTGQLVGFKGELIHIYNKNENAIHDSDYFENLKHRDNIVLLGDSIGDVCMADGATETANILKVGFLNDKIEERLEVYKNAFDIVIVSDETMDVPNAIVKEVLES